MSKFCYPEHRLDTSIVDDYFGVKVFIYIFICIHTISIKWFRTDTAYRFYKHNYTLIRKLSISYYD